jgi:hypothetical protein
MSWEALYAVTQSQQGDIRKYADEIVELRAEVARLRAAGRALAPHAIEDDELNDTVRCRACGAFLIDGVPFEHLNDCPTLVFLEESE